MEQTGNVMPDLIPYITANIDGSIEHHPLQLNGRIPTTAISQKPFP